MKRTLSLVLALVMVLGSFTTVFAAEAVDTAAEFLAEEGVLLGDADGDLMLEDNLERRDAVILLSRLLGAEDVAAEFTVTEESPTWEDARTDAYYTPFFAWAEVNGYFEGNDDGTFAPRNAITAPEFSLVLLRALGYEVNGHEAWAASLEQAEELGLLEGVEVEFEDFVVRGEMAVMIFNALGTEMNDSDETLAEYLGIEMPVEEVTELDVEDVYAENLMEVVIELSNADLADEEQLENPNNYAINRDIKVVDAEVVGDDVVLLLQGGIQNTEIDDAATKMVRNREYELTIKGIDRDVNGKYKFTARDNSIPAVESVEVLGEYGIKVTTSEPVDNPQERDFYIDGSRESMILEQYGRDIILTPYHNEEFDEDAEELEIRALVDYSGYRSTAVVFDIEVIEDDEAPEVVDAYFYEDGKEVYVVFDKDIYEDSVKKQSGRTLGNASFEEGRRTFYATGAAKFDTNVAVYTFDNEWDEDNELLIQGVQNHSKVAMERTSIVPEERGKADVDAGVLTNNDKRQVIWVENGQEGGLTVAGEELVLELEFDKDIKEIDKDDFVVFENYVNNNGRRRAENDGIKITDVEHGDDEDVLLVSFNILRINDKDKSYDYILEVNGLKDEDGEKVARDYMDFEVRLGSESKFAIKGIDVKPEENYIDFVIEFNDEVDRASARDARNYLFSGNERDALDQLDGEAIVDRNGERVTLRLPIIDKDHKDFFDDYEVLEISHRVVDLDGDALASNDRTWEFVREENGKVTVTNPAYAEEAQDEIAAAISKISALADNPVIGDREKVKEARAAYDALTEAQRSEVPADRLAKLERAEANLADSEKTAYVNSISFDGIVKAPRNDHAATRGRYVSVGVGFVNWVISDFDSLEITIFAGTEKVSTMTLKDPSNHSGNNISGSIYENATESGSWLIDTNIEVENIGDEIFDNVEVKVVKDGETYTFVE